MIHGIGDLQSERHRLRHRPPVDTTPGGIAAFDIETEGDPAEYSRRLRDVLGGALDIAVTQSFEGESVSTDTIPSWFARVSGGAEGAVPDFARTGIERFTAAGHDGPWELQDWLYRFDPESEFRGWSWWDMTRTGPRHVRLWVDSQGEPFFSCDDLRWPAYASGATRVEGPVLIDGAVWAREEPI